MAGSTKILGGPHMSDEDLAQPKNIGPVNLLTLPSRIVLYSCTWTVGLVGHLLHGARRSSRHCTLDRALVQGKSGSDIAESGAVSL